MLFVRDNKCRHKRVMFLFKSQITMRVVSAACIVNTPALTRLINAKNCANWESKGITLQFNGRILLLNFILGLFPDTCETSMRASRARTSLLTPVRGAQASAGLCPRFPEWRIPQNSGRLTLEIIGPQGFFGSSPYPWQRQRPGDV